MVLRPLPLSATSSHRRGIDTSARQAAYILAFRCERPVFKPASASTSPCDEEILAQRSQRVALIEAKTREHGSNFIPPPPRGGGEEVGGRDPHRHQRLRQPRSGLQAVPGPDPNFQLTCGSCRHYKFRHTNKYLFYLFTSLIDALTGLEI